MLFRFGPRGMHDGRMSERIRKPKVSHFFLDPSNEGKARCLDCYRRESIYPVLENYAPTTKPDESCWKCGGTLEKMAVRRFRAWTAMGEGGAAIASLAPYLHAAAKAAERLVIALAKMQRSTTSAEELGQICPEQLREHQRTWGEVCRLVSDRSQTVEAASRASFLSTAIMPALEKHMDRHSQVTMWDGMPYIRLFGARTFYSPDAKTELVFGPILVERGELVRLNPHVDFGPIGPGDTEIEREALVEFAGALEMLADFAETAAPRFQRDEGEHAWRYLMHLAEDYGIRPKRLAKALFDAGVDRSSLASIESKINVRLSQLRKERSKVLEAQKTKQDVT